MAAKLRPGNVHSAEGWKELLLPKIARQQQKGKEVVFRADADLPSRRSTRRWNARRKVRYSSSRQRQSGA